MSDNQNKECPYVTGTVTRYCTLTPFTLTEAERYAVMAGLRSLQQQLWSDPENLGGEYRDLERYAATLRGLLERTK